MRSASTDQIILDQASGLRAEADRLLHEEGLFGLVSAVGPAAVIGSFTLDLMTWPDIDISVQLDHERDIASFFDLGRGIATRFQATRMSFSNQFIRPDTAFDHGLYWGIRLLFAGREWKVDLWGYGAEAFREHMQAFDALRQRLEGADRLAILRVKDAVCRRSDYRFGVYSMDVYSAVLDHHVQSVEQFDEWLRARAETSG